MQRIRAAMAADQGALLRGIIEADETFIGGKPRKRNSRKSRKPAKRGRGTKKTAIIGTVERGGNVKAQVADDLTGRGIQGRTLRVRFIRKSIDPEGSLLISDEYAACEAVRPLMPHLAVNHSEHCSDGHINTIEGFWSLLKRAWYGSHHHYWHQYTPLYIAEASWKYNHRQDVNGFGSFIRGCFA